MAFPAADKATAAEMQTLEEKDMAAFMTSLAFALFIIVTAAALKSRPTPRLRVLDHNSTSNRK